MLRLPLDWESAKDGVASTYTVSTPKVGGGSPRNVHEPSLLSVQQRQLFHLSGQPLEALLYANDVERVEVPVSEHVGHSLILITTRIRVGSYHVAFGV